MAWLNRLTVVVGLVAVGAFVYSAFPERWFEVLMIFGYGILIGHAFGGPGVTKSDLAPTIPWDEMRTDERFTHFLGPVAAVVFGSIFFAVTVHWSRVSLDWAGVALAIAMILGGVAFGAAKWTHRHAG
jgi:hypothetical protein